MDEILSVQDFESQDTKLEDLNEEKNDVSEEFDDIILPDNDVDLTDYDVRDGDDFKVQESLSENVETKTPFVSVQYNHKTKNFTKQEAIQLIQKGMHTEALRSKLEFLAKSQGTDVNSIVERIVSAPENAYRKHLEELYGKNNPDVEIGMAIYREKQSKEYKKIMSECENSVNKQTEKENVNSRLADEYMTLKTEIPEAPDYCELPDSVIVEAAKGTRDLYSAYLHYLYKEKSKIDAANKVKAAASAASLGKMSTENGGNTNSEDRKFLSGLWQK